MPERAARREDVQSRAPPLRDPSRQEPVPRPRLTVASPRGPSRTIRITIDATNQSSGVRGRTPHKDVPLPPVNRPREKNKSVQQDQSRASSALAERPCKVLLVVCEGDRPDLGPIFESDEQIARMHPDILTLPGVTATILAPSPAQSAAILIMTPRATAVVPDSMPARTGEYPVVEEQVALVYLPKKTLLNQLADLSRPEQARVTLEVQRVAREVLEDPGLPTTGPRETLEPSMARYADQTVALIKNWVQEKADHGEAISVQPSILMLSKLFLRQIPQEPRFTVPASVEDSIPEFQLLCVAMVSWASNLHREVCEDRQTRAALTKRANGRQVELDALRQQYDLTNLQLHPTSTELMEVMNRRVQFT
ncbi:hypothetical protein R1flu_008554 [Riccia fluitans]|uniref:Uncharacterized protein n=1 Tax=Riccia fluitans TaxID=41844 RepID=A0ABD1YD22_9MARC